MVVLTGLGFVIASLNVAIRVLFAMGRERALPGRARLSSRRTPVVSIGCVATLTLALGLPLTYAVGGVRTFGYLPEAGGLSVVLVYLAVNIAAIRAFRTEFRDEFRLWRHLLLPATAAVLMLFPLWGILHPRARHWWTCCPSPRSDGSAWGLSPPASSGPDGPPASRRWAGYSRSQEMTTGKAPSPVAYQSLGVLSQQPRHQRVGRGSPGPPLRRDTGPRYVAQAEDESCVTNKAADDHMIIDHEAVVVTPSAGERCGRP